MSEETVKTTMMEDLVDGLYFRQNLSPGVTEAMRDYRKACIEAAKKLVFIEKITAPSRELALAFKGIEEAIQYGIKHLCLVDPNATKEIL